MGTRERAPSASNLAPGHKEGGGLKPEYGGRGGGFMRGRGGGGAGGEGG